MPAKSSKKSATPPLKAGILKAQRRLQRKKVVSRPVAEAREMRSDGMRNVEKLLQAAEAIAISGKELISSSRSLRNWTRNH